MKVGGLSISGLSRREPQAQGHHWNTMQRKAMPGNGLFSNVGERQSNGEKSQGAGRNKGPRGRADKAKVV